jgi:hypothetical protein
MNRYPGDWIWAACLWPWYLAASTVTGIAEAVARCVEERKS